MYSKFKKRNLPLASPGCAAYGPRSDRAASTPQRDLLTRMAHQSEWGLIFHIMFGISG